MENFQPYFRMILLSSGSAGDPIIPPEAENYYSLLKKMPESKIEGSISSTVNGGKRRKKTRKKKRRKNVNQIRSVKTKKREQSVKLKEEEQEKGVDVKF